MKVIRTKSVYSSEVIFDVPRIQILNAKNPLYIAAREGQKKRVQDLLGDKGKAVGVWELGTEGYLNLDGTINIDAFKNHGTVFVAESYRVHEAMRPAFDRLVRAIEAL